MIKARLLIFLKYILVTLIASMLLSCGGNDPEKTKLSYMYIYSQSSSTYTGYTLQLFAIAISEESDVLDVTANATWSSSNTAVATVNSYGLVTGITAGTAVIYANVGLEKASLTVTIVPGPPLVSIKVTPVSALITNGSTQQFTATGTYYDGTNTTTGDITALATWSVSNTSVAVIDAAGLANSTGAGTATISATYQGIYSTNTGGDGTLTVTPALVSLAVTPTPAGIANGLTQQFTATGTYDDASTADLTSSVTWASDTTSVATIDTSGLANSVSEGVAVINATYTGVTSTDSGGDATLTVSPALLNTITVTPSAPTIANGLTQQFAATGTLTDGSQQDLTGTATWMSDNTGVATIDASGLATSQSLGVAVINATYSGVTSTDSSGDATLTVGAAVITTIAVTPPSPTIANGLTQQFFATATLTDASQQDVTNSAAWMSLNTAVATIDASGLATSQSEGFAVMNATYSGISSTDSADDAMLTVGPAVLNSIAVSPATASIENGTTQQFIATGTYTDLSQQDISGSATWVSDDIGVATVSSSGLAMANSIGTAVINATQSGITSTDSSGDATLTVTAALVSIAVTPSAPAIIEGQTQQLTATGTYDDASTTDLTSSVTWMSDNLSVATINSTGLVNSVSVGTALINATYSGISSTDSAGDATLTVEPVVLTSITVAPTGPVSIANGLAEQFSATGFYNDSSSDDLTNTVSWFSDDTLVALINSGGLANAVGEGGPIFINATYSGVASNNVSFTVTPAALSSIAVTPATPTIANGLDQQFYATGTYTDSSTQDITSSVTWASDDTGVATIDPAGLASSAGEGTAIINATLSGVTSTDTAEDATLTVTPAELVSIEIVPSYAMVNSGLGLSFDDTYIIRGTYEFNYHSAWYNAVGTYTDGSMINISNAVTWGSTNTPVADAYEGGLAIANGIVGVTVINATDLISGKSSTDTAQDADFEVVASTGQWRLTKIASDDGADGIINGTRNYAYIENSSGIELTDLSYIGNNVSLLKSDWFLYNSAGMITNSIYNGGSDGVQKLIYNSSGRVEYAYEDLDNNGVFDDDIAYYYYDVNNYLVQKDWDLGVDGSIQITYNYQNDSRGNVETYDYGWGGATDEVDYMTYDSHNNKLTEMQDYFADGSYDKVTYFTYTNDKLTWVDIDFNNDGVDYSFRYTYDANGNPSMRETLASDGFTVTDVVYYTWNFQ